ncbi:UBP1-associated protein 2A-like [Panicum miliaceum]|uniref:UBP1-associated protein 2A-like n=1 Tax=Panicum miliaceum TaxID=4540 RepID=A0A3L6SM15_PANMI|nr:UBP1-associated protein 2A-like [Panicum miliaceum]
MGKKRKLETKSAAAAKSTPAAAAKSATAMAAGLSEDQLVELLRDAAVAHGDVLSAVRRVADADPAQRKIFVHGLGWDATTDTLTEAFGPYGEIEDLRVVTDRNTGKCKGYGFILFRHRSGARAALREPQKKIGNRNTACQLASVGPVPAGGAANNSAPAPVQLQLPPVSEYTQRKIFVSNVGADIDPQKLLQFFARYGEIEEGPLGLDKVTGKPKGFALFVYKTIESAKKALEEPHKHFEGVVLHCQKAIDGPKPNKLVGPGGFYGAGASSGSKGVPGYGATGHTVPGSVGIGQPMSPLAPSLASLPGGIAAAPGVDPALGQALTALLATQGAGLNLNSILGVGANGSGVPPQGASGALGGSGLPGMQGGYMGGYGGSGGYGGAPSGGPGRNYMGH